MPLRFKARFSGALKKTLAGTGHLQSKEQLRAVMMMLKRYYHISIFALILFLDAFSNCHCCCDFPGFITLNTALRQLHPVIGSMLNAHNVTDRHRLIKSN